MTTALPSVAFEEPAIARTSTRKRLLSNLSVLIGGGALALLGCVALFAPLLGTIDPTVFDAVNRDLDAGSKAEFLLLTGEKFDHTFWMGADSYGRDVYSRVVYGARISMVVGVSVAALSLVLGGLLGLLSGYLRWLDPVLMRVMDGLMAIPAVLLAIALVAALKASLVTVIIAIAIPEIPRVTRLTRSLVLSIREEPYVEAAVALGTPTWRILARHILPNAMAPLIVQGTYVCAAAILIEAILSFLGVGLPTDIPTWGNIMAEGRVAFNQHPHTVLFPGVFLALTVLAVNMLGDGLRDTLDPKFNKRGER